MSMIERRISKLEQKHARRGSELMPGISDESMQTIRRTALICATPDDLALYLKTLEPVATDGIASLDDRRRSDAVRNAFACAVFDEARA